jgi:hypothetical protein
VLVQVWEDRSMSITLTMRLATDADADRWRRDPSAVERAVMAAEVMDVATLDAMARALADMSANAQASRPRWVVGWIIHWLIGRSIQASLREQSAQLDRVKRALAAPPGSPERADVAEPGQVVDLHKSWQVLHYLLTGTPDAGRAPLNLLLVGGEELGDDVGYGPARLIAPGDVEAFATALDALDDATLMARLDLPGMAAAGVYCADISADPEGDAIELEEMVDHYLGELRAFLNKARQERAGALIWMS